MIPTLESERLILRPPRPDDAEAIADGLSNFEVTRWLPRIPFPYHLSLANTWLATIPPVPTPENAVFSIELSDAGFAGCVAVESELGFWLAERYWGCGIMTEAVRLLLDWYFTGTRQEIASGALVGNERSLSVQRRLGFVDQGSRRRVFVNALQQEADRIDTLLTRNAYLKMRP